MKVYAACLGDSMACLFDSRTGCLVASQQRVWDLRASKQVGTKSSDCITHLHAIIGMLQFDDKGSVIGMDDDEQVLGLLALPVHSTNTDAGGAAGSRHPRVASPPQKTPIHHQLAVSTIRNQKFRKERAPFSVRESARSRAQRERA